jgi:hypothetical protein
VGASGVTLFDEGESDTLTSGKGDLGVLTGTNSENVGETGSEGMTSGVLDVSDLVRSGVVLDVLEDTDTADVVTASAEDGCSVLVLDDGVNFSGLKVQLKWKRD